MRSGRPSRKAKYALELSSPAVSSLPVAVRKKVADLPPRSLPFSSHSTLESICWVMGLKTFAYSTEEVGPLSARTRRSAWASVRRPREVFRANSRRASK